MIRTSLSRTAIAIVALLAVPSGAWALGTKDIARDTIKRGEARGDVPAGLADTLYEHLEPDHVTGEGVGLFTIEFGNIYTLEDVGPSYSLSFRNAVSDIEGNIVIPGSAFPNALLVKTDPNGQLLWSEVLDFPNLILEIEADLDGNIYVLHYAGSGFDPLLFKFGIVGNRLWTVELYPNELIHYNELRLMVDVDENIYVAGSDELRVRRIRSDGVVL